MGGFSPPRNDSAATVVSARAIADRAEGEAYVASVCFKHGPPRLLGVELEYTVHHVGDPARALAPDHLAAALGPHTPRTLAPDSPALPLPAGSTVTLEPGGQVELSTPPRSSLTELITAVSADRAHLAGLLAESGLRLGDAALDAHRPPTRLLATPRYAAMERRFAPMGTGGITMMCSTAGLQVCVDVGERSEFAARWAAAHALGPVLLALFANSRRRGLASARWRAVMDTEPARTVAGAVSDDPAADWAGRVLDTPLMVMPNRAGDWDAPPGVTFADWIAGRGAAGLLDPPTTADLDYHLTTLFTPVRPRGYLEIRYLDAQPGATWTHPVALLTALLSNPSTVDAVLDVCSPVADAWSTAVTRGLDDPGLARTARAVADLGCAALPGTGLSADAVTDITESVRRRLRAGKEAGRGHLDRGTEPAA
ncbi:glutamate-cysteine ligase family protein [Amycolatopsis suaedae]|uniref:glutamate-cysteine ligase family protein n=1 Tax=Amycolatopsis suaedae TaxID=2510978 RepID=UPI003B830598